MAGNNKIKVVFERVYVKNDADPIGSGEFYFNCRVGNVSVGDRRKIFDAVEGRFIELDGSWTADIDVTGKTEIEVVFHGKDQDTFFDDDLGSIKQILRPPWGERVFTDSTKYFVLEWHVELDRPPSEAADQAASVCRQHRDANSCTTLSSSPIRAYVELHPVTPPPPDEPRVPFPPRPDFTREYGSVVNLQVRRTTSTIAASTPLNVIPNPPTIPILTAAQANEMTCARIEFTYYSPHYWRFADIDPRLEWEIESIDAGAAVKFFRGQNRGLKALLHGTAPGEVLIKLKMKAQLLATYRALVADVKRIPCRFNILRGPGADEKPLSTAHHIVDHLAIANRFLRQMSLELVLDNAVCTVPIRGDQPATPSEIPGIFYIDVPAGMTVNVPGSGWTPATRLNYRQEIMNFAYIVSEAPQPGAAGSRTLGAASDWPNSRLASGAARPEMSDNGSPSTSWVRPAGLPVGPAAGTVKMKLTSGRMRVSDTPQSGGARVPVPKLYAMYVTNLCGDPVKKAGRYGAVIAHEFGHILNLGHRVEGPDSTKPSGLVADGAYWDGLSYPPNENVMHWTATPVSVDFDLIQSKGARQSPLVPR